MEGRLEDNLCVCLCLCVLVDDNTLLTGLDRTGPEEEFHHRTAPLLGDLGAVGDAAGPVVGVAACRAPLDALTLPEDRWTELWVDLEPIKAPAWSRGDDPCVAHQRPESSCSQSSHRRSE